MRRNALDMMMDLTGLMDLRFFCMKDRDAH